MRVRALLSASLSVFLASAAAADPAAPPRPASIACRASAIQLCPFEAATGDRQKVKVCLLKNLDKASAECQAAVKAARAEREAAAAKGEATAPAKP